jgi:hypothetical protein
MRIRRPKQLLLFISSEHAKTYRPDQRNKQGPPPKPNSGNFGEPFPQAARLQSFRVIRRHFRPAPLRFCALAFHLCDLRVIAPLRLIRNAKTQSTAIPNLTTTQKFATILPACEKARRV